MDVRAVAKTVRDRLLAEHQERVLAVGWYDGDADDRTDSVYQNKSFGEYAGNTGTGTLETAMLESISHGAYAQIHDEPLTTTVRLYDTVADIDLHLGELQGVVVAVRMPDGHDIDDIVDVMRDTAPGAVGIAPE